MINLKNTFFFILLINLSKPICETGCQRCKNNQCSICDYTRFYLKDNECILRQEENNDFEYVENDYLENCVEIDFENKCKRCVINYYLDVISYTCKIVEKDKRIENCMEMFGSVCKRCKPDYYSENNKCLLIPIEKKIDNCVTYEKQESIFFCGICKQGYIPSINGLSCKKTDLKNCLFFSYLDCSACNQNQFLVNKNNYITQIIDNNDLLLDIFMQSISLKIKITLFPVCYEKKVENCLIFKDSRNCVKCEESYYVQNIGGKDICVASVKINQIPNCLFERNSTCVLCEDNFLNKNGNCVTFTRIDHCVKHFWDSNKNGVFCSKCSVNFFLKSDNSFCLNLTVITNCLIYEELNDNSFCKICEKDYFLGSSKDTCFKKIENCKDHQCICLDCETPPCSCNKKCKKTSISCLSCESNYYLQNSLCSQGNIPNCEIYTDINNCKKCVSSYYLEKPSFCAWGGLEHCDVYKDLNNCELCEKNYVPTKMSKKCTFYPYPESIQHFYENCHSFEFDLSDLNKKILNCTSCDDSSIQVNMKNSFLCFSEKQLLTINDFFSENRKIKFIANCAMYDESDDMNCFRCEEGYFLYNNQCLSNCENKVEITEIYSNEINQIIVKNICVDQIPFPNCIKAIFVKVFDGTNFTETYICQKCELNYYLIDDFSTKFNLLNLFPKNIIDFKFLTFNRRYCHLETTYTEKVDKCIVPTLHYYTSAQTKCFFCEIGYKPDKKICSEDQELYKDVIGIKNIRIPHYMQNFLYIPKCTKNKVVILNNDLKIITCKDVPPDVDVFKRIPDCGIYFLINNVYYCLFCNPGYRRGIGVPLESCLKIDNCDINQEDQFLEYDGCTKCQKGFAFKYSNEKVSDDCVKTEVSDCFAADEQGNCIVCNESFMLMNKICEKLIMKNCLVSDFGQLTFFNYFSFRMLVGIHKNNFIRGCTKCEKDFNSVKIVKDVKICEKSDYLLNNTYVKNCENYFVDFDNFVKCKKCLTNYSLTYDKTTCIYSIIKFCNIVDINLNCISCEESYMLKQNKCEPSVGNCKKYENEKCQICNEGYVLVNLKDGKTKCFVIGQNCVSADLTSDAEGTNNLECKKCENFYYPENQLDSSSKCLLTFENEDTCLIYDKNKYLDQSTYDCVECDFDSHYLDKANHTCRLREKKDSNCENFDNCADQCEGECKCGNCEDLTNINGCKEGYFFDKLISKICDKFPDFYCLSFSGPDQCQLCKSSHYLDNGVCRILEKNIENCEIYVLIEEEIRCLECYKNKDDGVFYYLNENKCIQSLAKNCKSNKNEYECLKCYSSFYLSLESDGVVSCLKNPNECVFYQEYELEEIEKNENFENSHNFNFSGSCKSCLIPQETLDNTEPAGKCLKENPERVANCEIHEKTANGIICKKCQSEYALKNNQCESIYFISKVNMEMCANFFYNFEENKEIAKCSLCEFGFFLKKDICVSCESIKVFNCSICVEGDEENSKGQCLFCKLGYFMDNDQKCFKNKF